MWLLAGITKLPTRQQQQDPGSNGEPGHPAVVLTVTIGGMEGGYTERAGHRHFCGKKSEPYSLVNILFTAVGDFLTLEGKECLVQWRTRYHIVEQMPIGRVISYLRVNSASSLALVDAIVCMADSDTSLARPVTFDTPLEKALVLAKDVRNIPGTRTMRDGRKWKSVPFAIFCGPLDSMKMLAIQRQSHAQVYPSKHPLEALKAIGGLVDEYHDRVLNDYQNLGILVRFDKGRAQIGSALKLKNNRAESEYYYAPGDGRNHKRWVTVKRDSEGLRQDVELFHILLERQASERELHKFFEEHPAILMEARLGIPISHRPRFSEPEDNVPDFSFSSILGPWHSKAIELMELKGPAEATLYKGPHPGFSAKVSRAVNQVRDYGRYLCDPANIKAIKEGLGYLPDDSKLAVLIGRSPKHDEDKEIWAQRQSELNVEVVTYDQILETQANQLKDSHPYRVLYGTPGYPIL